MLRRPRLPRSAPVALRIVRIVAVLGLLVAALGPLAGRSSAAAAPTMEARVLLGGHARIGSWLAISVHLKNDGPAMAGELRLAAGSQGQTRFGRTVDLPTGSDKTYVLYAQPPSFGNDLEVALIEGDRTVASAKTKFTSHDASQLVVAVIAEHPDRIVGSLDLLPNINQVAPVAVGMTPEDLPDRVEAWAAVDRIVWQDIDSSRMSPEQLDALRAWVAGGGRLVIAGGTAGPKSLSAFPDTLLPYRPVVTIDTPPDDLGGLLGELPPTAATLPALSGTMIEGRTLATVGDGVVAAERSYGSGSVTLIGFDPTVDWISRTDVAQNLWRRLLPARSSGGLAITDDNLLLQAVSQLPSLALPPIGGLLGLLGAYILLIGPINYFVLRRLDRREWAWFTMPALIVVFAIGAYTIGFLLRGNAMIVNEIGIVRGAPGATDGTAQVYVGIFSPSRGNYQVRVPGGALLSAPISGDFFGGNGSATNLDVLQGDPAQVRDLDVGYGSLRAIRAESAVAVPLVQSDMRLENGRLKGTLKNASAQRLERPAIVLGQSVEVLGDLEPGATADFDFALDTAQVTQSGGQFGGKGGFFGPFQSLSDKVVGPLFNENGTSLQTADAQVRHNMVDQLTYDPNFGPTNLLPADGPVVLAWGAGDLLQVDVEGQEAKHLGDVLYYLPAPLAISGQTTFRSDLIRSTMVDTTALVFNKDPSAVSFGRGTATIAYRPIAFDGRIEATELAIGINTGDPSVTPPTQPVSPLASLPPACPATQACPGTVFDGTAEVELFDLDAQTWRRLPHLTGGTQFKVTDPAQYVDPTSGTVLVRFVNDQNDSVGFNVDVSISGTIR